MNNNERLKNVLSFRRPSQVFVVITLVMTLSIGLAVNRSGNRGIAPGNYSYADAGNGEFPGTAEDNGLPPDGTPYVGAAHETGRIIGLMPLPAEGWQYMGFSIGYHDGGAYGPYTLTIFYEPISYAAAGLMWEIPYQSFEANASFLFEHIGNLRVVYFSVLTHKAGQVGDRDVFSYRWSRIHNEAAGVLTVNEEFVLTQ